MTHNEKRDRLAHFLMVEHDSFSTTGHPDDVRKVVDEWATCSDGRRSYWRTVAERAINATGEA